MHWVKMKVGRDPANDLERVAAVREVIGDKTELMVDANGAYDEKEALRMAEKFSHFGVSWFEEPVSSDDLEGLRSLRNRLPHGMEIAAGEYGYELDYFRRLLEVGAVDVLQADASRCCGITGLLKIGSLAEAYHIPISSHCAPSIHLHPACALTGFRHAEYFYDHVRIEERLFEGVARPINGCLQPDLSRPGIGLEFKKKDAEEYRLRVP
jgi:L-alanine-DL-glutamate epimerase-like enolase superfamily enzyme